MSLFRSGLIVILGLIFLGCSSTQLHYDPQQITLHNSFLHYTLHGKETDKNAFRLSPISIDQRVFSTAYEPQLVFEYARLDAPYKFKSTLSYTLGEIFHAKSVESIKSMDGFSFFVITFKDDSILYALAKNHSRKQLHLLYGFSKENFMAMQDNRPLNLHHVSKTHLPIKTHWRHQQIILGELIEQQPGMKRKRP